MRDRCRLQRNDSRKGVKRVGVKKRKDTKDARTKEEGRRVGFLRERGLGLAVRSSPVDLLLLVLGSALLEQGSVRGNGMDDRKKPGDCQEEQTKVDTQRDESVRGMRVDAVRDGCKRGREGVSKLMFDAGSSKSAHLVRSLPHIGRRHLAARCSGPRRKSRRRANRLFEE